MKTLRTAVKAVVAFIAFYYALSLLGCINNPKKLAHLAQCYGKYHGYNGQISIEYSDRVDWRACNGRGRPNEILTMGCEERSVAEAGCF